MQPLTKVAATNDFMTLYGAIILVLGFLAVVLLLEGVFALWSNTHGPEAQRVRRRLQMIGVGDAIRQEASILKQRTLSRTPELHRLLVRIALAGRLDRLLLQAGSALNVMQVLTICLGAGFLSAFAVRLAGWAWALQATSGLLAATLPIFWLEWQRSRRLQKINAQLPEAMDLISRALRAGHAFSMALHMVGSEAQEPIALEFRMVFDEINFGLSAKAALLNLAARVPLADMRYFVMAVLIQLETGGNLAELLAMLAGLTRSRYKLLGNIQTLAAEGKFSAYILVGLPFFLAFTLQLVNPGYMDVLYTDPLGLKLVIAALFMMVLGVLLMWRLIRIHV
jgi:tight adherence protein B